MTEHSKTPLPGTKQLAGLEGKIIVVTGAASGMGLATSRLLLDCGAAVIGIDRNTQKLESASREIGSARFTICAVDLASEHAAALVASQVGKAHGTLHGLANVAGITIGRPFLQTTRAEWETLVTVNSKAPYFLVQALVPLMVDTGRCAIVNVSSVNALRGNGIFTAYSASKGAVVAMSRAMAASLSPQRIRVNSVCPGAIDTPMMDEFIHQKPAKEHESLRLQISDSNLLRRMASPMEVANLIAFLLSDLSSFINGDCITIDGGTGENL